MDDNSTQSGKRSLKAEQPSGKSDNAPVANQTEETHIPMVTKGQKYVSPTGRHSQQTHRRAEERAATQGHSNEKEQHAHDRGVVSAEINRKADQKLKQQANQQKVKSAVQQVEAPESDQENK